MAAQIQTIRRLMPLAEALARVDALTMADVKATAGEMINDQNHALAAIGGIHKLLVTIGSDITPTCCGTREMSDRVEKRSIG